MSSFNEQVITEFRANGGRVESAAGFGSNLVLIHSRGAQTGRERVNPALALRDGDGWLVIGSAKGAPKHPGWVFNLRAESDAEIEVPGAAGVERVAVTAAWATRSVESDVAPPTCMDTDSVRPVAAARPAVWPSEGPLRS